MTKLSRREFLKLSAALTTGLALHHLAPGAAYTLNTGMARPNILMVLFDAMSATNLSVYGYPRKTTPHLERFAQRATVYHRHYAGANFTTPGTASLLTGLYPWTHRAFNQSALVRRDLADRNIFSLLGTGYRRAGFAQNYWADLFLHQFSSSIDRYISPASWSLIGPTLGATVSEQLDGDHNAAYRAYVEMLFGLDKPRSLLLGFLDHVGLEYFLNRNIPSDYPMGVPLIEDYHLSYINEMVFDGLLATIKDLSQQSPYFAYFHLWSPHDPYRARKDFIGIFNGDSFKTPEKALHPLAEQARQMRSARRRYDEYITNVDAEFGRLMDSLESRGLLKDTCVIVISDHGEAFERGQIGHGSPLLYEPVIRIPLLISMPGQQQREDVYLPTSNVDLLPTLAKIAGVDAAGWGEGQILPGFGGPEDAERNIFVVEAKGNSSFAPLTKTTLALLRGDYKLIHYRGYSGAYAQAYELYDIRNDPDEMVNLYNDGQYAGVAASLQAELLAELDAKNQPYKK